MFSDAVGGFAAFFLGAPAHAETPVVRPPQVSPASASDWKEGVPEDAQCAVNVVRHFLSPSNPDEVAVFASTQHGTVSIDLNVYRSGQNETVGFYWDTPRSREDSPVWSLQHTWDRTTMSGGRATEFTGYLEHGRVNGYIGGPIGSLFDAEASRFDDTYPFGTQQSREVKPVAVPYLFNAIKTTCDLLS